MEDYKSNIYIDSKGFVNVHKYSLSYKKHGAEAIQISLFIYKIVVVDDTDKAKKEEGLNQLISYFDVKDPAGYRIVQTFQMANAESLFSYEAYERILAQMLVSKLVDNFLSYLKDILSEIITIRPEILKSEETEKLDFILGFSSMEDLRLAIAEKKIEALSYRSFNDIVKFFETKVGIKSFIESDIDLIKRYIKERNLIVHNRGIINKQFVTEFKLNQNVIGKELKYNLSNVSAINEYLQREVSYIDSKVTAKFDIKTEGTRITPIID